jgi:hypothetical protein
VGGRLERLEVWVAAAVLGARQRQLVPLAPRRGIREWIKRVKLEIRGTRVKDVCSSSCID